MIKKYGSKILTSVSFTGIAISNIKAGDTGGISFKIGDKVYNFATKKVAKTITKVDELIVELEKIEDEFNVGSLKFKPSEDLKNYFIESITSSTDQAVKLDKTTVTLVQDKPVEIKLVPKRERIKFKYTTDGKQLTTAKEDELLSKIVQGKTLVGVTVDGLTADASSKLGNVQLVDSTEKLVGKDIKLFESVPCELTINSGNITGNFKTFILDFAEGVKNDLVSGLDLSKFDTLGMTETTSSNTGTTVLDKLNKVQLTSDPGNISFFKGKFEILKDGLENAKTTTDNGTAVANFSGGKFYILKGIKKENINAKYLKKSFKVQLESNDANKKIVDSKDTELENALNEKFKDSLTLSSQVICDFLKTKNGIIKNDFTGKIKIGKGTSNPTEFAHDNGGELVNADTPEFVIKLPEAAFAPGIVQSTFTLTFDTNISKNNKKLKESIKTAIEDAIKKIKSRISKENFANEINKISSLTRVDSKSFDKSDFDFGSAVENNSDDITKGGTIMFNQNGIAKIADSCFDDAPKPKTNDSNGSSSSDGSGDKKGSTGGCCCKGKNNAQKEDKKDKKS